MLKAAGRVIPRRDGAAPGDEPHRRGERRRAARGGDRPAHRPPARRAAPGVRRSQQQVHRVRAGCGREDRSRAASPRSSRRWASDNRTQAALEASRLGLFTLQDLALGPVPATPAADEPVQSGVARPLSSSRRRAGRSGLCSTSRPLSRTSCSRSGMVSPVMMTAGTLRPQAGPQGLDRGDAAGAFAQPQVGTRSGRARAAAPVSAGASSSTEAASLTWQPPARQQGPGRLAHLALVVDHHHPQREACGHRRLGGNAVRRDVRRPWRVRPAARSP